MSSSDSVCLCVKCLKKYKRIWIENLWRVVFGGDPITPSRILSPILMHFQCRSNVFPTIRLMTALQCQGNKHGMSALPNAL